MIPDIFSYTACQSIFSFECFRKLRTRVSISCADFKIVSLVVEGIWGTHAVSIHLVTFDMAELEHSFYISNKNSNFPTNLRTVIFQKSKSFRKHSQPTRSLNVLCAGYCKQWLDAFVWQAEKINILADQLTHISQFLGASVCHNSILFNSLVKNTGYV